MEQKYLLSKNSLSRIEPENQDTLNPSRPGQDCADQFSDQYGGGLRVIGHTVYYELDYRQLIEKHRRAGKLAASAVEYLSNGGSMEDLTIFTETRLIERMGEREQEIKLAELRRCAG